jgi:hypothetical protein
VVDPGSPTKAPPTPRCSSTGKTGEWNTADGKLTGWIVKDGVILTTARRESAEQKKS